MIGFYLLIYGNRFLKVSTFVLTVTSFYLMTNVMSQLFMKDLLNTVLLQVLIIFAGVSIGIAFATFCALKATKQNEKYYDAYLMFISLYWAMSSIVAVFSQFMPVLESIKQISNTLATFILMLFALCYLRASNKYDKAKQNIIRFSMIISGADLVLDGLTSFTG